MKGRRPTAAAPAAPKWARWACVCGERGTAPTETDAMRCWRVHYANEHVHGPQARTFVARLHELENDELYRRVMGECA